MIRFLLTDARAVSAWLVSSEFLPRLFSSFFLFLPTPRSIFAFVRRAPWAVPPRPRLLKRIHRRPKACAVSKEHI